MTFKELINQFEKDSSFNLKVVEELIFYLSNTIKDKENLIVNINNQIDFDINNFMKLYKKIIFNNVPLEYVVKYTHFLNIKYYITKNVFIPRPETEYIVDYLIKNKYIENAHKIIDLCSGSGAICNTIQYYFQNKDVYGIEKKIKPFFVSKYNAKIYKLKTNILLKDIFELTVDFLNQFDLIICNPPYISKDFPLEQSVLKEPHIALYADDNGLFFYKKIITKFWENLKENKTIVFEIGFDQKEPLTNFLKSRNINNYEFIKDLSNNDRILIINK